MNLKQAILSALAVMVVAVAGWFAYPYLGEKPHEPEPLFADWAAVVIAGDWRAHNGQPSEVFDNGRREIAKKLVSVGFRPSNILQFSVRPERYAAERVQPSTGEAITNA